MSAEIIISGVTQRVRDRLACLAIMSAVAGIACGPTGESGEPAGAAGTDAEAVQLSVGHRSEWRELWVEGATDLPDGAHVNYRVTHEIAETAPADEWPVANLMETGRAAVLDGQFWTRINTYRWPAGQVRILVQFPLPPQPPEVDARFGAFGERLSGDNVTDLGGMKAVEVEHVFDHRR